VGKVFLSHSSKDKPFVEELYRRLTRDGVDCFYDAESIGWGENWVRALERAIDECEYIIFVMSPDFCNSKWAEVERTSSIADEPSGLKRKVRPLLLRPCKDLKTFPRFLKQVQHIDVSTTGTFEKNYPKICRDLGGVVRADPVPAVRGQLPPVVPLPTRHRMPYRSLGDHYIGRVDDLWRIHDQLTQGKTTVVQSVGLVVGTGGIGKTQLAIEYVHRFAGYYPGGVFWVEADFGLPQLIAQTSRAAEIEIDGKLPQAAQLELLWRGLNTRPPCLIVLDNFPEQGSLQSYLPVTGSIHTLVTTRRRDLTGYPFLSLNFLPPVEALKLLNTGQRQFNGEAAPLIEALGGLPLALELAKNYLNYRADLSIPALVESMRAIGEIAALKEFARKYGNELPSKHELDVAATFKLSWDLLGETEKNILTAMSYLAPVPVPRPLLLQILQLPAERGLTDPFGAALSELARLSLVELDKNANPLSHRLILSFVRSLNQAEEVIFQLVKSVLLMQMERALDEQDTASYRELEPLLPHAQALSESPRLPADDVITVTNCLGKHHWTLGRYAFAKLFCQQSLASAKQNFSPGHPRIATSQSNLALVLQDLGELAEARELLRSAYGSFLQKFGPHHPKTKIAKGNLESVEKKRPPLKGD